MNAPNPPAAPQRPPHVPSIQPPAQSVAAPPVAGAVRAEGRTPPAAKPAAPPVAPSPAALSPGAAPAAPAAKPAAAAPAAAAPRRGLPETVKGFTLRLRHLWQLASFVALVLLPTGVSGLYLYLVAHDQYTSEVGFAVRSEGLSSALGFLGGLSSLSGASSSDADILYRFIQSQELVGKVDAQLNLRALYGKPAFDPVFSFPAGGSIEDLTDYWHKMVRVSYDNATGLIELRVHAFEPADAKAIADAIFTDSAAMINALSAAARADATRYAREELDQVTARLSEARIALTEFRSRTQIVDPSADVQGKMGLLNTLQAQQVSATIELELLRQSARPDDPRIEQGERRIAVIEEMMATERRKLGVGSGTGSEGDSNFSTLVGEFERLAVEREFAEKAYVAARATFDTAQAEAQRKSRYLAAYSGPTLAETALYPQRGLRTLVIFAFSFLIWSVGMLIYYSVRDRR